MNINVQIQRLVLEEIDIPHVQRPVLQAAVEAELTRLLENSGLAPELKAGGAMHHMAGGNIQIPERIDPVRMGHEIARAVYEGLGR